MINNLPEFFKSKLLDEYGEGITEKIIDGLSKKRKTTFRVNTLKSSIEEIKNTLHILGIKYKQVEWYKEAFILDEEYKLQNLSIYKEGKIYLQSLSSMIPAVVLNPKEKENILDMCAAPGRKNNTVGYVIK